MKAILDVIAVTVLLTILTLCLLIIGYIAATSGTV